MSEPQTHDTPHNELKPPRNRLLEQHPFICGYLFLAAIVLLLLVTELKIFALTFLFLYLLSDVITNDLRRMLRLQRVPKFVFFSILYVLIVVGLALFSWQTIPSLARTLPVLIKSIQGAVIETVNTIDMRYGLDQYIEAGEVQNQVIDLFKGTLGLFSSGFGHFYKFVIFFIFALFVNLFLYHNTEKVREVFGRKPQSLMGYLFYFTLERAGRFYYYFKRVMGGQLAISLINTLISAVVIVILGLPYPTALILTVFFLGLFPVVGNIVSNTLLTLVALASVGLWGAAVCLCLLVGIHKLEYFLNSKIIGEIVKLPMFVTLTSLVVFELVLGIPGLILAIPLTLTIRHEFEDISGLPQPLSSDSLSESDLPDPSPQPSSRPISEP
ncbi:MAG: AI-2E family transporter [Candidatus Alcyoniella australis]|nr:AI-2E family transporter [Candidatus Alcyoniella australis]